MTRYSIDLGAASNLVYPALGTVEYRTPEQAAAYAQDWNVGRRNETGTVRDFAAVIPSDGDGWTIMGLALALNSGFECVEIPGALRADVDAFVAKFGYNAAQLA